MVRARPDAGGVSARICERSAVDLQSRDGLTLAQSQLSCDDGTSDLVDRRDDAFYWSRGLASYYGCAKAGRILPQHSAIDGSPGRRENTSMSCGNITIRIPAEAE
jgi:hypothetical protein